MNAKVKDFVKKHKKAIINGTILIGGIFVGYCLSNKFNRNSAQPENVISDDLLPYDNNVAWVLNHAEKTHPGLHRTFGLVLDNDDIPLKSNDLGAIGEYMKKCGVDKNQTFTDFIFIGENME